MTEKSEISTIEVEVYRPADFCIEVSRLFPGEEEYWATYASVDGFLRLKPMIFFGTAGLEGTLALANPPADTEVDAWEASKRAGVWDYWIFLGLTCVPSVEDDGGRVAMFFLEHTFFDRELEVLHTWSLLEMNKESREEIGQILGEKNIVHEWECLWRLLEQTFGATTMSGKKWLSEGGTYYDEHTEVE